MGRRTLEPSCAAGGPPAPSRSATGRGASRPSPFRSPSTDGPARAHGRQPDADLAIPDYEALSASQVVRRLDGLGPDELEAVYRHESATRGRRTILHRVQQLLGREEPPGPGASAAS